VDIHDCLYVEALKSAEELALTLCRTSCNETADYVDIVAAVKVMCRLDEN
jgi:hypothetical protein